LPIPLLSRLLLQCPPTMDRVVRAASLSAGQPHVRALAWARVPAWDCCLGGREAGRAWCQGGLLPEGAAFSGSWMMQLICCRTKVLLIRGEPLITGDCTFPKNLRYEIWADLSPMVIRYAHKIISTNHVVVIRTRKRPFKSNILQSLDKLGSGYWHKSTQ